MNEELRWLEGLKSRGIKIGLERMKSLMEDFPLDYRVIHVGGTNGKG
ncbi:MAG TPA: bifunctional folylpolyglutamate synthase/dihydrofolate synthase, partial [Thermoplasmatales archaeon]|nr:bifunctional folylpolyglutamate synthase/dihydrofolate synthase [Thermoplasmatales archaeon]